MSSIAKLGNSKSYKEKREEMYTKFLEKSDVVQMSFDIVSWQDTFDLIRLLYDDLTAPLNSNYELFQLLIKNEQMVLFDQLLKFYEKPDEYQLMGETIKESDEKFVKNMR